MWVLVVSGLFIFLFKSLLNDNVIEKKEYDLYMDFLNGNISIGDIWITDIITPTGELDKQYYSKYTFVDCDEDNFKELHVKSQQYYYIIDCKNEELYVWKYLHPNTELLNNGDYLYLHIGEAPLHYDYEYFSINKRGEKENRIGFSWYDENSDRQFDEGDLYIGESAEVISYEEWKLVMRKYINVGTDEIIWIVLTEAS